MAKDSTNIVHILLGYILLLSLLGGAIAFFFKDVSKEDIQKALNAPQIDTIITIHNGVPDTVITIRK